MSKKKEEQILETEETSVSLEETQEDADRTVQEEALTNDAANVADLPGVGPKTAEKLKEAGYADVMAIATASAGEIAAIAELGEGTAAKIIAAARTSLKMGFETGLNALERRKQIAKMSTGSATFDNLLGGGVETGSITEA